MSVGKTMRLASSFEHLKHLSRHSKQAYNFVLLVVVLVINMIKWLPKPKHDAVAISYSSIILLVFLALNIYIRKVEKKNI